MWYLFILIAQKKLYSKTYNVAQHVISCSFHTFVEADGVVSNREHLRMEENYLMLKKNP